MLCGNTVDLCFGLLQMIFLMMHFSYLKFIRYWYSTILKGHTMDA